MHEQGQKMQRISFLIQREEISVKCAFYTLAEVFSFFLNKTCMVMIAPKTLHLVIFVVLS